MKELNNYIVEYIETNKVKYNIDYIETIKCIEDLIKEIKTEYENIKESE